MSKILAPLAIIIAGACKSPGESAADKVMSTDQGQHDRGYFCGRVSACSFHKGHECTPEEAGADIGVLRMHCQNALINKQDDGKAADIDECLELIMPDPKSCPISDGWRAAKEVMETCKGGYDHGKVCGKIAVCSDEKGKLCTIEEAGIDLSDLRQDCQDALKKLPQDGWGVYTFLKSLWRFFAPDEKNIDVCLHQVTPDPKSCPPLEEILKEALSDYPPKK